VRKVPEVNARHERGVTTPIADIHLSVALFLRGGGLVVPALHHVDRLPLGELWAAFRDLTERARAGRLRSSELSDGTLTVTSLGERGAETVQPVIFPPQVAIVGLGATLPRPWVLGGAVVAREVLQASFAGDHRVLDGHAASRFLRALESILGKPEALS
jgi:pyruvate dehydrogenase E2 component (dihydrolipoamide acetyltransferase)